MDRKIFKWVCRNRAEKFFLPVDRKLLHVAKDSREDFPTVWYEVGDVNLAENVLLVVFPTGALLPNQNLAYLGTAHIEQFVWHVYEQR